jgi:hypothetical protein
MRPNTLFQIKIKKSFLFCNCALLVQATQTDNQVRNALTMLNIRIQTRNEYAPLFNQTTYEASIRENAAYGAFVAQVQAVDDDKNPIEYELVLNDTTAYSLANSDDIDSNPFVLDPHTGIIRLNRKLDYELKSEYSFQILAKDGMHTTSAHVHIAVTNLVDTVPVFSQLYYNFKITSLNDVFIGQVKASDIESTNTLAYLVTDPHSLFCISATGIVYVCPSVDRTSISNAISEYDFDIYAQITDPSNPKVQLKSRVDCRVQIDGKSSGANQQQQQQLNANEPNDNISPNASSISSSSGFNGNLIEFKSLNQFYAYLAIVCTCIFILFISVTVMIWYRCENNASKPPLFIGSASTTTNNSTRDDKNSINKSDYWMHDDDNPVAKSCRNGEFTFKYRQLCSVRNFAQSSARPKGAGSCCHLLESHI